MKMYVWVRNDLQPSQQAVQSGHAVAEYLLQHPNTEWNNGTLIYLSIPEERHFHKVKRSPLTVVKLLFIRMVNGNLQKNKKV